MIIHQNNSISSNVNYLNNFDSNNSLVTKLIANSNNNNNNNNNNSMESSSFSSTSSTSSNSNNIDIISNFTELNSNEDIKYMKGYVNVIKERFTRRSLGILNNDFVYNETNPNIINSLSNSPSPSAFTTTTSVSNNQAIRMSINDYQRRKQQTSASISANNRVITSHNDYQRRRSASPFTNRCTTINHHFNEYSLKDSHVDTNNISTQKNCSRKNHIEDVNSSNDCKTTSSLYTKNNVKKQFASSDDLRNCYQTNNGKS